MTNVYIPFTADTIKTAKTSDLLEFYNKHRTPIKKFRDRATAEQRVLALITELGATTQTAPVQAAPAVNPVVDAVLTPPKNPKTLLAIIRDHSGSMYSLVNPAMRDFNSLLGATKRASVDNGIQTKVSVLEVGGIVNRVHGFVPVEQMQPITNYRASGGTPLFQGVLDAIKDIQSHPDYNNPEASFIVAATTDGQDTGGRQVAQAMQSKIRELQLTDRWTFIFRVPTGYARDLVSMGVAPGNILEWEQSEKGAAVAQQQNDQAFTNFFAAQKTGTRSSRTFYTSVANVSADEVKATLGDISGEVQLFPVSRGEAGMQIRDFVEGRLSGRAMLKGAAFYQLVKTEDKIQDYKLIAIREKSTGQIFCGPEARDMIGLPRYGDARVRPDTAGAFEVFVQSTSVNRKVDGGTQLMYWEGVGARFKEGKSAR